MSTPIHVLILEDRAADAELMLHELRQAGFDPDWQRVEAEPEYLAGLEKNPGLILADWNLPQFSGLRALQLMNELGLDIPFIIVSGSIGEEAAIEAVRQGASDYLLKDRPARLGPAVRLALKNKQMREERKKTEYALRVSEERFRRLMENAQDIIYRIHLHPTLEYEYISPAVTAITGYTPEEHYADPGLGFKITHPDDRRLLEAALRGDNQAGKTLIIRLVRKDGVIIWTEQRNIPIFDEGKKVIAVEGISRDITERKMMEEKVKLSEARYRSLVEMQTDVISRSDLLGNLVFVNDSYCSTFGISHEQELGKNFKSTVFPEDLPVVIEMLDAIKQRPYWEYIEVRNVTADGVRWFGWENSAVRNEQGTIIELQGVGRDITERKQAEETLQQAEKDYRSLFENVPDGVYRSTLDGKFLSVNPALVKLFGYSSAEELRGADIGRDLFIDPEARQILANTLLQKGELHNAASTMHRKDGQQISVLENTRLILDAQGKALYFEGTLTDYTERKQAEDQLSYQAALLANVNDAIVASDSQFRLTAFNPAAESLYGWKAEEVLGRNGLEIFRTEWSSMNADDMRRRIAEMGRWRGEATQALKDGKRIPVEMSTIVLRDKSGQITGFISVNRDITERKQAEEALRQSEARFRFISQATDEGIVMHKQGRIVDINETGLTFSGYTREELIGQSILVLSHPDSHETILESMRSGSETPCEATGMRKDGTTFPCELRGRNLIFQGEPVRVVVVRDLTESKQTQILQEAVYRIAAAAESTSSLDELYPQIHQIISSVMPAENFYITLIDEAQNLMRFPYFKDAQDEPYVGDFQPGKGLSAYVLRTSKSLLCTQAVHDELERKGEVKLYGVPSAIWLGVPLVVEGKTIGAMVVQHYSDPKAYGEREQHMLEFVSTQVAIAINRKQKEDEIRQLNATLEQRVEERTRELRMAQEQLVRSERLAALGQLAGGVGHELRNPLSVINTSIYYLKLVQPEADGKIKEHLAMIEQEVHNADKIISDLLDYARVISSDRKTVSAARLVSQTLKRFPVPPAVKLKLELPDDIPNIYADPRQVEQVLGNLVTNAFQAMASATGVATSTATGVAEGGRLTISARLEKKMVGIAVKDTGTGITPENMQNIFEPLFTTKAKGIGLGLAVSRKLAEANGGRIEVESQVGTGSTFTLVLPIKTTVKREKRVEHRE